MTKIGVYLFWIFYLIYFWIVQFLNFLVENKLMLFPTLLLLLMFLIDVIFALCLLQICYRFNVFQKFFVQNVFQICYKSVQKICYKSVQKLCLYICLHPNVWKNLSLKVCDKNLSSNLSLKTSVKKLCFQNYVKNQWSKKLSLKTCAKLCLQNYVKKTCIRICLGKPVWKQSLQNFVKNQCWKNLSSITCVEKAVF